MITEEKMKQLFGKREVVATGIGTALFVVLTTVEIPLGFVPKTALQPRMAVLAFIAGVFGPIAGALTGLLGHAIGDVIFYGSIWWSWVFPEAVVGLCIGLFHNKYAIKDGNFANPVSIIYFNVIQAAANAVAWIAAAPVLDILVYQEPVNKVFAQGFFAFIGNTIVIGIMGSALAVAYSAVAGKPSDNTNTGGG